MVSCRPLECQHVVVPTTPGGLLRIASPGDGPGLVRLWALLFDEDDSPRDDVWRGHAREWFTQFVARPSLARFPLVEVDGEIVATAIGTLEVGVPNPQCPRGRTVRLANVITLAAHRSAGYGTLLVNDVTDWARSIDADRVDLSATPEGQRIYARAGFVLTSAPRMKLVL
jgi:GNAT superfamily N-acetyltransferase